MTLFVAILSGAVLAFVAMLVWNLLIGFRAQSPGDYAHLGPDFDLRNLFDGNILCEGVIHGPSGRVVSRFEAKMVCTWEGNVGHIDETFRYDGGETQHRYWDVTVHPDGSLSADAPDILGTATGRQSGSALCLRYRLRLPEDSGGHVLWAVDWMYLLENGVIMNRSQFRKFGIKVAELVATMRKVP